MYLVGRFIRFHNKQWSQSVGSSAMGCERGYATLMPNRQGVASTELTDYLCSCGSKVGKYAICSSSLKGYEAFHHNLFAVEPSSIPQTLGRRMSAFGMSLSLDGAHRDMAFLA